ncbi:MAG TPA: MmgE/PrpD family protein [Chloroflexota bacterium]|nr:MmgE/PrpD family protein [Chloroflexota bacterium]
MTAHTDAVVPIADFTANLTFDRLPDSVVMAVKRILLDTLGTTLAANTLGVGCKELVRVVQRAGGSPDATLIGIGGKIPAANAALANGGLSHALNFDDVAGPRGSGHMGVTSIPAALAAAEYRRGVSGRDFLTAIAAGNELMARLGLAISLSEQGYSESKPQPTQMPGCFSATVSAGRALGLSSHQVHSALGHALMQASGGRQPVLEGRPAKAIYAAYSNQVGMLSALLVEAGLDCDCEVFEGEAGLFKTYYHGRYQRDALADGLGNDWRMLDVGFKLWPTTNVAAPFIDAARQLRDELDLNPDEVSDIHIIGGAHARTFCEPESRRKNPQSPVEGEDSIFFATAKALATGNVTLADLQPNDAGLRQREALLLTSRMHLTVEDELNRSGIVEVTLMDGRSASRRVDTPVGHPSNPMPAEMLQTKFFACAQHASLDLSRESLERVVDLVEHVDDVEDIAMIPRLLGGES